MAGKTYNTTGTIEQTLKVYPTLYAVIGMRFHSIVLAAASAIPYISISYGSKTAELLDLLQTPDEARLLPENCNFDAFKPKWTYLGDTYDRRKEAI